MHYLDETHIFIFLAQLFVILLCARGLGELFRRWKQPAVTAELLVGIVLGPTILGRFSPGFQAALFPHDAIQQGMFETVAWLGVLFLLLDTGLEIDFSIAWRQRGKALAIAATDIVVPMALAFPCVYLLPDSFLVQPERRLLFSLFMATVVSISAMPIAVRCLHDLNLLKTDLGFLAVSALAVNDVIGWVLFGILLGIFTNPAATAAVVAPVLLGTVGFAAFVLTLGRRWSSHLFAAIKARHFPEPATSLTVTLLLGLLFGAITQKLGVHALFGFFLAGIAVGEAKSLAEDTRRVISQMVYSVFVPLFFVNVGLKIDFIANFHLGLVLLIGAIGIGGRYFGTWLGATLFGVPRVNRHLLSITHAPGGIMEIVVALLALECGLIQAPIFVAVVFGAVFSSVVLGPWMARALAHRRAVTPAQFLDERAVVAPLAAETRDDAIRRLAAAIAACAAGTAAEPIANAALAREREFGTGIGHGVAIPHVRLASLRDPLLAYGHSAEGLDWDAPDAEPVHHVFFLASAADAADLHVQILAQIARALEPAENRRRLAAARDGREALATLRGILAAPSSAA